MANTVQDDEAGSNPAQNTQAFVASRDLIGPAIKPNRRQYNPLGKYASYTYQLTLYMITPDAHDEFVASGRQRIDAFNSPGSGKGAYIIAQSGGVSDPKLRAEGFSEDYYIDNLKITSHFMGPDNQSASVAASLSFQIIEPYGFSFVTNLRRAADQMQAYSQRTGKGGAAGASSGTASSSVNSARNFFVLGFRFYGWDSLGNPVNTKDQLVGSSDGIYEKFYDFVLSEMRFKLDGKAVVYDIKGGPIASTETLGMKRGQVFKPLTLNSGTVGGTLKDLADQLNRREEESKAKGDIGIVNKYSFVFNNCPEIENAATVIPNDKDKTKSPGATTSLAQNNDAVAVKTILDLAQRPRTIEMGTPIIQAVSQVIAQSSYLTNAINILFPADTQGKSKPIKADTDTKIAWFSMVPQVSNSKWDKLRGDWTHEITYTISKYETPVTATIAMPSVDQIIASYYGPCKKYKYWFTGENSEIISYEQTFNNAYYLVSLAPELSRGVLGESLASIVVGALQNAPKTGEIDKASETINQYVTGLLDPETWANSKVTILGDPDFLMPEGVIGKDDKFYGPDPYTINPNSGQVFIEIDFKEGKDYDTTLGLMRINETIRMWPYPSAIDAVVDGVSFLVTTVNSEFSRGKFIQTLTLAINTFGTSIPEDPKIAQVAAAAQPTPAAATPVGKPDTSGEN